MSGADSAVLSMMGDDSPFISKPSVLVVDDEKRVRDVCIKMLRSEDHEAGGAASAEIGLQMIQQKHFDIILMDLMRLLAEMAKVCSLRLHGQEMLF